MDNLDEVCEPKQADLVRQRFVAARERRIAMSGGGVV